MARAESAFCRSAPWNVFARRVVLPWTLSERDPLSGDVLEIGAGSGAMAAALLTNAEDVRLTAVDVDPAMVEVIRRRLQPFGDRARAEVADAAQLPYDDGAFDVVCSWLMLHHTIEWERCLAEAVRVLRPGGWLVGYDLTDTRLARIIHRLDRSPHRLAGIDELQAALAALPIAALRTQPGLFRHVLRFAGCALP